MPDDRNEPVLFEDWHVYAVSDKSVLVGQKGQPRDSAVWLPKSQVDVQDGELEKNEMVSFEIPRWLADDREMEP